MKKRISASNTDDVRSIITKGKRKFVTDYVVWKNTEKEIKRLDSLGFEAVCLFSEIYRRLRKFPEYNGAVAVIFAQSEYAICKKMQIDSEKYNKAFDVLVDNEWINVILSTEGYCVVSVNKRVFITNYHYYGESGTDSEVCSEFFDLFNNIQTERKEN